MDLFGEPEAPEIEDKTESPPALENEEELFAHPRTMPFCAGQEKAEHTLLELYHSNRMPHGIIFAGQKGIGKATTAFRLARFLLKNAPKDPNQNSMFDDAPAETPKTMDIPSDDRIFRQVASGGHPDLLTIERTYDATKNKTQDLLAVAELRKVEPFLRRTASEGGWRVVIIDDADTMNRNAQNALLKILEEPPAQTVIILVAHRAGALIPTIRSRARTLNFDKLSPDIITDLLAQNGTYIDPFQGETLSALAEGSFGAALGMLEDGGLEMLETILEFIKSPDWPKIHSFADQISRAGQETQYKTFTTILLWIYKTLSFAKARGLALQPAALNEEPLSTILQNSSLAQLLKICENLSDCFESTARANLDKRQAVLSAFKTIQQ